jgi:hypothetical protein
MAYQNKISKLYFFNSGSFMPDAVHRIKDQDKIKLIWVPDIPDSIEYVIHLLETYSEKHPDCYIEKKLGWMVEKLKITFPQINFNEILPPHNAPVERTNKVFLYPQSDTLADSLLHVYFVLPAEKVRMVTPRKASEGTLDFLNSRKIPCQSYSFKLLKKEKPDVMVFLNDWTKEVQRIIAHCRRLKIATVCLQESVIDFGDHFKRMQHTDYAFVQGSQTAYDLNREIVYITGNPRYENLKQVNEGNRKKVLINCNFTYNIYEDIRYNWLDMITATLDDVQMEYLIIQHPRDNGDLSKYRKFKKTNSANVHNFLSDSSILITRFSSLIHEALIMGIPVIYFNPHDEKMLYGFEFNRSFIQLARNKEELRTSIKRIMQQPMNKDEHRSYMIRHCLPVSIKPSEIISGLLMKHNFISSKFRFKDLIRIIIFHPIIRALYRPFVPFIKPEKN